MARLHPWLLLLLVLWTAPAPAAETARHVLLLNSYNQSMTWVENIVAGVTETLRPLAALS